MVRRPSPEEMLARAAEEEERGRRGRLKVFFGAAPGVGKTYAMLEAARARAREGGEVVVGWLETHGRAETEALAEGLERIPPRAVEHRGVTLRDFDLDAALARRPALLLVDELAHTNAPGARHARRWQDVEELLAAGIPVFATLNVQHLESLNDVVAQITGVRVRETVPDSVLDQADEVELVDLPPEELLKRLAEGKVYVPDAAQAAVENFFRTGNLLALRELALQRTAERVDAQMASWRREHGVERPWPTRERVMVGVSAAPQSANLVRAAARMAKRLRAPWIALSVETPATGTLPAADQERLRAHIALAESLGAETMVVQGEGVAEALVGAARARNVTRLVVGKPTHPRWRDRLRGSLLDEIVRASAGIDVLATTGHHPAPRVPPSPAAPKGRPPYAQYGGAAAIVAAVTVVGLLTRSVFELADHAMLYLLGVVAASVWLSRGPSLMAAVASVAALDFFFVPPAHTFAVADVRHLLTFAIMLGVGLTVSSLTLRIRHQAAAARERERRTDTLYRLTRALAATHDEHEIALTAHAHVAALLGVPVAVIVSDRSGALALRVATEDLDLDDRELAVARWVFDNGRPAGRGTDTLSAAEALYLPLAGADRTIGVLGAALDRARPGAAGGGPPLGAALRQLLDTVATQVGLALERARLAAVSEETRLAVESERLRNALLSAISHDLRTPLAGMTGSASALLDESAPLDPAARRELLSTIHEEAERLTRVVGDILELTRLEAGGVALRLEPCPLEDVAHSATARLRALLADRPLTVSFPDELLLAQVDTTLVEEVLVNLLENAVRHSPAGTPIELHGFARDDVVHVVVADRGPGIPEGEEERIFDRFYRVADGQRGAGSGLGLAICRAIVRAHGGRIEAARRPGGGSEFRFTLPRATAPTLPDDLPQAAPEARPEGGRP